MSAVDAVDFVDMLEKHGFSRTEAKMFIDFNQARVATKDDLNLVNISLSNKIDSVKQELESKMDFNKQELEKEILSVKSELKEEISSVKSELKDEISRIEKEMGRNTRSQILWTFGMFITFFGLNSGFVYFLLRVVLSN